MEPVGPFPGAWLVARPQLSAAMIAREHQLEECSWSYRAKHFESIRS